MTKTALLLLFAIVLPCVLAHTKGCRYNLRLRTYSCENGGRCLTDRFSLTYCECRRGFAGKACEKKCFEKNVNVRDCCNDLTTTCAYAHSDDVCGYKKCLEAVLQDNLSCPETSRARHDVSRHINQIGQRCNTNATGVVQKRPVNGRLFTAKHTAQPAAPRAKPNH